MSALKRKLCAASSSPASAPLAGPGRDFYSIAEVAAKLGMSAGALRMALWRHREAYPRFIRLGARVLCPRRAYEAWEERAVMQALSSSEGRRKPGRPRGSRRVPARRAEGFEARDTKPVRAPPAKSSS